ncbi:hypothetical protein STRIP9103_09099 [Streptomyces ipomoeae 91-03]|uniref:Uncharacterized protein n=1 Tax=Streptomyces ipomoeae 91-03 TaxID=698759 RepID=L1L7X7_9ACTN|nr:hypothetical protein STRIP9103_09099 [Streptomyces ipomoeae 91-03]
MFQRPCPRRRGKREAPGRPYVGPGDRSDDAEPPHHPGRYGSRGSAQGAGGDQRHRHSRVGAVEQPGGRQRGGHVGRRHGGRKMMPGVPVSEGRRRMGAHGVRHVADPVAMAVPGLGQGEVERPLSDERARHDRGRGETAAGDRPDEGELRDRENGDQAPRHRAPGDPVMAEGREYAADEREQPGPDACLRTTRPRTPAPAVVPRHVITPCHGPSEARPFRRPGPWRCRRGRL